MFKRKRSMWQMAENQQWDGIRERLQKSSSLSEVSKVDFSGLTLFGVCIMHHAPLDIVRQMADLSPSVLPPGDLAANSPLHLACEFGAPIEVVEIVLEKFPSAAVLLDHKGQTPLHHAVTALCEKAVKGEPWSIEVVVTVYNAAPKCADVVDKRSLKPLDRAFRDPRCRRVAEKLRPCVRQHRDDKSHGTRSTRSSRSKHSSSSTRSAKTRSSKARHSSSSVRSSPAAPNRPSSSFSLPSSSSGHDIDEMKDLLDWRRRQSSRKINTMSSPSA